MSRRSTPKSGGGPADPGIHKPATPRPPSAQRDPMNFRRVTRPSHNGLTGGHAPGGGGSGDQSSMSKSDYGASGD